MTPSSERDLQRVKSIDIASYDYPLPDERIARHPLAQREQCKLLVWDGEHISDAHFADVPRLLPPDAMLVYNNTRVINARLRLTKDTGAVIEIFCLKPIEPADYQLTFQTTSQCTWQCLVGNSKRWKQGPLVKDITLADGSVSRLTVTRGERDGDAWHIHFSWTGGVTWATLLETIGEIPIPPYLNRNTEPTDSTDYQTVYSHIDGSVAAPTAGLHFTEELLAEVDRRGIVRREVTLHVGAGTFQPVKSDTIGDHAMHHEFYEVTRDFVAELAATSRPVVAVGTTTVRTLESLYHVGRLLHRHPDATDLTVTQWMPYDDDGTLDTATALQCIVNCLDRHGMSRLVASTQLMIAPGYRYHVVDGMITNFHQPQSTLLLLVSAYLGDDRWRNIYRHALDSGYRFLSYGDACLFLKH